MFWFFAGVITALTVGSLVLWVFFKNMHMVVNEGKMVANHLEELCKIAVDCSDAIVSRERHTNSPFTDRMDQEVNSKHLSVVQLYNNGYTVREISEELQLEADQVDLILRILKQNH